MSIIVNSTPLISLAIIHQLDLLQRIFGDVVLPRAVFNEVIKEGKGKAGYSQLSNIDWFRVIDVANIELKRSIKVQLDEGEAEVITVAKDQKISLVCIDEFAGRQYASLLGLDVIGTLGILLIAKRRGYIPVIKPLCDKLISNERFISRALYDDVLYKAGE
ncbi:MAG: DUF3368 domain-containing protein [Defluviitaleaceae bacterium]|nr:DUF3368 domain-containing protein [Defluviitaleaceae bacterium]